MKIIDSHAHLNDPQLLPLAEEIHAGMDDDGLEGIINVGYDVPSSLKAVELTAYDNFYAAAGIHPHDSKTAKQEDYDLFINLAKEKKIIAIGEIGLDYHYDLSPRETQKRVFVEQLEIADFLKLPTVIHLREAYGDMMELLRENRQKLTNGILLHCYSGSKEIMLELARMGAYFSFGGAITFKNATDKPEILRATPKDRILIETDCPYMTPVPHRGKTNLPKYVNLVADRAAEILGLDRGEFVDSATENTRRFFKI